jgi:uncharacterized membrane protein YebE (DUF533 family)
LDPSLCAAVEAVNKETSNMLRLLALGALGYAGYKYYDKNRDQVDGALRRFSQRNDTTSSMSDTPAMAGGPLSDQAQVVHAGEGPLA